MHNPNGASNGMVFFGTELADLRRNSCIGGVTMSTMTADPMPRQF